MSTMSHYGPRWGANFARLLHTTVCRLMACWLIFTLPLYGLPVHALAPTSGTMEPLPDSFGSHFDKRGLSATAGLSSRAASDATSITAGLSPVPDTPEPQPLTDPAPASLLYVNNTDPTCHGQQPCFTTIQAAIDAVQPGQTIRIQPGAYQEQLDIKRKNRAATATEADRITLEADPEAPVGKRSHCSAAIIKTKTFTSNATASSTMAAPSVMAASRSIGATPSCSSATT